MGWDCHLTVPVYLFSVYLTAVSCAELPMQLLSLLLEVQCCFGFVDTQGYSIGDLQKGKEIQTVSPPRLPSFFLFYMDIFAALESANSPAIH